MITILFSIILSSSLVICFKLFDKWKLDTSQAIAFNYLSAASIGVLMNPTIYSQIDYLNSTWFYYTLFFGLCFISVFKIMAIGVRINGIIAVSVAQKMSLILPVLFSIYYYDEGLGIVKIIAILLALISVYFTSKKEIINNHPFSFKDLLIPGIIFFGSGLVDIFIKITQEQYGQIVSINVLLTCIFGSAGVVGFTLLVIQKVKINWKSAIAGIVLGIFNFSSTWFLMKALSNDSLESSFIFAINNMGIILFSTFIAYLFFKEKISKLNWLGIAIALTSIIVIYISYVS